MGEGLCVGLVPGQGVKKKCVDGVPMIESAIALRRELAQRLQREAPGLPSIVRVVVRTGWIAVVCNG